MEIGWEGVKWIHLTQDKGYKNGSLERCEDGRWVCLIHTVNFHKGKDCYLLSLL
jgi:hypothetical protein